MKLVYHKGKNFGDAINPFVLDQLFPNFFDEDDKEVFLGIGSIIGLKKHLVQKKIVFSSGYAAGDTNTYGGLPVIDKSWDIRCVRGPLTAEILNIDPKLAVCDGAILLNSFYKGKRIKHYKYSYIPHHSSFKMFSKWKELLAGVNIHLIDPRDDYNRVLEEIDASEFIITEAMHGAIIADALRVPWHGVKSYPNINEFKWNDWASSLNMTVNLSGLPSLHEFDFFRKVIDSKTKSLMPNIVLDKTTNFIENKRKIDFLSRIGQLKNAEFSLSNEKLLQSKCDQLCEIAQKTKKAYQ